MTQRGRNHIFIIVGVIGTGIEGKQALGNFFLRHHLRFSIRQIRTFAYIPILDTFHLEVIVLHVEFLAVLLKIRITGYRIKGMSSLEFFHIREITLGSQVLRFLEMQFRVTRTIIRYLIPMITGLELMQFPLTVLVAQSLGITQSLYRLDVQFHCHLRLEPFVESLIVCQHTIGHDVVIQRFPGPYIITGLVIRIVHRTGRVIIKSLSEVRPLLLIRSIGSTGCLAIIHDRADLQPTIEQLEVSVQASTIVLTVILERDTLVCLIKERGVHLRVLRTQFQREVMLLREIILLQHRIPPIRIRSIVFDVHVRTLAIFIGRQHLRLTIILLLGKLGAIIQFHLTVRVGTALRGDQDHTRGSTRTIDSAGGSIFQYVDRLDIILVQGTDITARETVDNNQRSLTGFNRSQTTQLDRSLTIGTTIVLQDQTTDPTLQRAGDI